MTDPTGWADQLSQALAPDSVHRHAGLVGSDLTTAMLAAMIADAARYDPHVHTFHPDGGLCLDCGVNAAAAMIRGEARR